MVELPVELARNLADAELSIYGWDPQNEALTLLLQKEMESEQGT
jgi:hypothetical protein